MLSKVLCPDCESNNWDQIGLFGGTRGVQGIQAKCNDCGCKFEMHVYKQIKYEK